jgi:hypothetical protein
MMEVRMPVKNIENEYEILRGCHAIAREIGTTERRAYALLEAGQLPAQKEGNIWVTTRERLRRHYSGGDVA